MCNQRHDSEGNIQVHNWSDSVLSDLQKCRYAWHCSSVCSREVHFCMKLQTCPHTIYMSTTNIMRVVLYFSIHISRWSSLLQSSPSMLHDSLRMDWISLLRLWPLLDSIPFINFGLLMKMNVLPETCFYWQSWYPRDLRRWRPSPNTSSTKVSCELWWMVRAASSKS